MSLDLQYLEDLRNTAPPDHPIHEVLSSTVIQDLGRIYFCDRNGRHLLSPNDVPQVLKLVQDSQSDGVCICENIGAKAMGALGAAWNLDHDFFVVHASGTDGKTLSHGMMERATKPPQPTDLQRTYHSMDGFVSDIMKPGWPASGRFQRRETIRLSEGWCSATRISYCRVSPTFYLFLVDVPFDTLPQGFGRVNRKANIRVPFSDNTAGLPLPQPFEMNQLSPFDMLTGFVEQPSGMDAIFGFMPANPAIAIEPVVFAQFWAAWLWHANICYIANRLKVIAFEDLRDPKPSTTNDLHDLREMLNSLRGNVGQTNAYLLEEGKWERYYDASNSLDIVWPATTFASTSRAMINIERSLMDTFQLLMSTLSIRASESSIQDAKRGILLTQLATIYIPLSFVTGIWGMNVREINGSPRPMWMFGVTLVAALFATAALLYFLTHWRDLLRSARRILQVFRKIDTDRREDRTEHAKSATSKLV